MSLMTEASHTFTYADRTLFIDYKCLSMYPHHCSQSKSPDAPKIFCHDRKSEIKWIIDADLSKKLLTINPVDAKVNKIFIYYLSVYVNSEKIYGPNVYAATAFQLQLSNASNAGNIQTFSISIVYPKEALVSNPQKDNICALPKMIFKPTSRQEFTDVKFIVDNKIVTAHKHILADRSEVFRAMFLFDSSHPTKNNDQIQISDATYEGFSNFIDTIYYGAVQTTDTEICLEMIVLAEKYDIQDIKFAVESSVIASISLENVINILITTDLHKADRIKTAALEFCVQKPIHRMDDVKELAKFPDLMVEVFAKINEIRNLK